jgi:CRISPR/Cas system CSM-associated protein Csm5 (group 7 of RAMP superfamily)
MNDIWVLKPRDIEEALMMRFEFEELKEELKKDCIEYVSTRFESELEEAFYSLASKFLEEFLDLNDGDEYTEDEIRHLQQELNRRDGWRQP